MSSLRAGESGGLICKPHMREFAISSSTSSTAERGMKGNKKEDDESTR